MEELPTFETHPRFTKTLTRAKYGCGTRTYPRTKNARTGGKMNR